MNLSNAFLFVAIAGAIAFGVYWYQTEGADLCDALRRSENKPFFMNQYDW